MSLSLPHSVSNPYLYMQYRKSELLQDFNKYLKEYIQENIYDLMQEWLNAINYQDSNVTYIFFWAKYYLGLPSMWGAPQANTFYDNNALYDNQEKYDNYEESTAFIGARQMTAYTRFLLDYSRRCLSLPLIMEFCASYCQCDVGDFVITAERGHIYVTIPNTELGLSLFTTLTSQNLTGMPQGAEVIIWKVAIES